jgi:hypothetical protein
MPSKFIELHHRSSQEPQLINTDDIKTVRATESYEQRHARIEFKVQGSFEAVETYDEVRALLLST